MPRVTLASLRERIEELKTDKSELNSEADSYQKRAIAAEESVVRLKDQIATLSINLARNEGYVERVLEADEAKGPLKLEKQHVSDNSSGEPIFEEVPKRIFIGPSHNGMLYAPQRTRNLNFDSDYDIRSRRVFHVDTKSEETKPMWWNE